MVQKKYDTLILKRVEEKFDILLPISGLIALLSSVVIFYSPIPLRFAYIDGAFGLLFLGMSYFRHAIKVETKIFLTVLIPMMIGLFSFLDGGFSSACITLLVIANAVSVLLLSKRKSMWISVLSVLMLTALWYWSTGIEKESVIWIGHAKWIIQMATFSLYLLMQHNMVYAIRGYLLENIRDLEASMQKTYELAYYDQLTGLPNQHQLKKEIQIRKYSYPEKGTFLFICIKNLSLINSLYGESMGDAVLIKAANVIRKLIKEREFLARVGGNEFGIWLNESQGVSNRIHNITDMFHDIFELPGLFQKLELVTGYAVAQGNIDSTLEVYKKGVIALTFAKTHNRLKPVLYDASVEATIRYEETIKEELSEAIANDEFEIFYQKKIDSITGMVLGVEALARWHNKRLGNVKPDVFIPVIEKNSLAIPFGAYIFEKVLKEYALLCEKYHPNVTVSINVSPSQLMSKGFAEYIEATIYKYQVKASCIILEITENVLIERIDRASEIIERIKKTGVKISLDDFGTGYSSLSYLTKLNIDEIKIDKSFVWEIGDNKMNDKILEVLVNFAMDSGLDLVAEGVETEEQMKQLIRIGCTVIQGFLISKPEPLEEFPEVSGGEWLMSLN